MPGFQNTVDSPDGTSVRLIMQCQYRSICRGETSIFGRLRAHDIEPEDYIQFYSLRTWGKIGPSKMLVTEQLYIHAKCMVVDDRIAIIGSANINERSMLGTRDSECAAIVRDTDMVWSTMNGQAYRVGRFPHSLRMRLMREHLGLEVDEIMETERQEDAQAPDEAWEQDMDRMYGHDDDGTTSHASSTADKETEQKLVQSQHRAQDEILAKSEELFSFNHDVDWEHANNSHLLSGKVTEDSRVTGNLEHGEDVKGRGADKMLAGENAGVGAGRDTAVIERDREVLVTSLTGDHAKAEATTASRSSPSRDVRSSAHGGALSPEKDKSADSSFPTSGQLPALPSLDDGDIGGPSLLGSHPTERIHPFVADIRRPVVDKDCMKDPLSDAFHLDIWHAVAENNTKLYRQVFRCMPDNEVKTWKEYKEYAAYSERFSNAQGGAKSKSRMQQEHTGKSGPPGASAGDKLSTLGPIGEKVGEVEQVVRKTVDKLPDKKDAGLGRVQDWAEEANQEKEKKSEEAVADKDVEGAAQVMMAPTTTTTTSDVSGPQPSNGDGTADLDKASRQATSQSETNSSQRRRRRTGTRGSRREFHASDDIMDMVDAEEILKMTQGNLVVWPYDWYSILLRSRLPFLPR